jgi:hypothetical protein
VLLPEIDVSKVVVPQPNMVGTAVVERVTSGMATDTTSLMLRGAFRLKAIDVAVADRMRGTENTSLVDENNGRVICVDASTAEVRTLDPLIVSATVLEVQSLSRALLPVVTPDATVIEQYVSFPSAASCTWKLIAAADAPELEV